MAPGIEVTRAAERSQGRPAGLVVADMKQEVRGGGGDHKARASQLSGLLPLVTRRHGDRLWCCWS